MEDLRNKSRVCGIKQSKKALQKGNVSAAIIARDAEERLVESMIQLCEQMGVPYSRDCTIEELGKACGLDIGCAAVALLKE